MRPHLKPTTLLVLAALAFFHPVTVAEPLAADNHSADALTKRPDRDSSVDVSLALPVLIAVVVSLVCLACRRSLWVRRRPTVMDLILGYEPPSIAHLRMSETSSHAVETHQFRLSANPARAGMLARALSRHRAILAASYSTDDKIGAGVIVAEKTIAQALSQPYRHFTEINVQSWTFATSAQLVSFILDQHRDLAVRGRVATWSLSGEGHVGRTDIDLQLTINNESGEQYVLIVPMEFKTPKTGTRGTSLSHTLWRIASMGREYFPDSLWRRDSRARQMIAQVRDTPHACRWRRPSYHHAS